MFVEKDVFFLNETELVFQQSDDIKFTFVFILSNSTHLKSKMFLLATCMIQINPLVVINSFSIGCHLLDMGTVVNMEPLRNMEARNISVSYRPKLLRDRSNQCTFLRPVILIYTEATQMNELGDGLSVNCTDHSVFPWSVKLVTDLCL